MKKGCGLLLLSWGLCMVILTGYTVFFRILIWQAPETATLVRGVIGLIAIGLGLALFRRSGGELWTGRSEDANHQIKAEQE